MKSLNLSRPDVSSVPKPRRHRLLRGAAALTVAGAMTLSIVASGVAPAIAQEGSIGTAAAAISPAETVLYFGFSLDTDSAQWQLADELLRRAGSDTGLGESIDEIASVSLGSGDLSSLLGGEAAVVVTSLDSSALGATSGLDDVFGELGVPSPDMESSDDAPAGAAFIIKPGDLAAAATFIESDLASTASGSDVAIESTEYNGVTIKSVSGDELSGDSGTAYAIVGEFIVVSETPADLEGIIDVSTGAAESLASLGAFSRSDKALAGDRLGFGLANGGAFLESLEESDTSGMELGSSFDGLLGAGGYAGISMIADPAGFKINTVQIPADEISAQQSPGASAAGDLTFAEKVPAETLLFGNGVNFGQGALLQSLGLFLISAVNGVVNPSLDEATPVVIPSVDEMYAQAARLVGFNLKTGFIDQMVGEYGVAVWGTITDDPGDISAVLVSGVETPAVVTDALSKISLLVQAGAQGRANVTTRVIGDSTVSVIEIAEDGGSPVTLEYGVVNGEFLLGVGHGIDDYLTGTTTPLADSADYQAALAALPAEYRGSFFVNLAQVISLAESSSMMGGGFSSFEDSSDVCGQYASQEEAQAAYDEDTVENFDLDLDFDGLACDDYFAATPSVVASPVAEAEVESELAGLRAFATVTFNQDGLEYTNSILLIAE